MAKPEWGTKRLCLSCAAKFYDLGRSPIVCPACGAVLDLETVARAKRPRPAIRGVAEAAVVGAEEGELVVEEAVVGADAGDEDVEIDDAEPVIEAAVEEEDDAALIEDADDLADEDIEDVIDDDIEDDPDAPR